MALESPVSATGFEVKANTGESETGGFADDPATCDFAVKPIIFGDATD